MLRWIATANCSAEDSALWTRIINDLREALQLYVSAAKVSALPDRDEQEQAELTFALCHSTQSKAMCDAANKLLAVASLLGTDPPVEDREAHRKG